MIKLKSLLSEYVDSTKYDTIVKGMQLKNKGQLDFGTFGVEIEIEGDARDGNDVHEYLREQLLNNRRFEDDYYDWLQEQRDDNNPRWDGDPDNWNDVYGPCSLDGWDEHHEEPSDGDFEDQNEFATAHDEWYQTRRDVESTWDRFERRDKEDWMNDFADKIINDGDCDNYNVYMPDPALYPENYFEVITDNGEKISNNGDSTQELWGVGIDGDNIEIRSRWLTQNDFEVLSDVLYSIANQTNKEQLNGNMSAHVHVGLPKDFDIFDLVTLGTLADEKAIKADAGPSRNLQQWARLNESLHRQLISLLPKLPNHHAHTNKPYIVTQEAFHKFVILNVERYHGTNMGAFRSHGTIEFRYFGANLITTPEGRKKFIQWIRYFMLLPKIAITRKSIVLRGVSANHAGGEMTTVTLTRLEGGKISITYGKGIAQIPKPTKDVKNTVDPKDAMIARLKAKKDAKNDPQQQFSFSS